MTEQDNQTEDPGSVASHCSTAFDHRIIDAVSVAMDGRVGSKDDVERLRAKIQLVFHGSDHLNTACEIAVAFMRYSQDLKGNK